MVARPPVAIRIEAMTVADLPAVHAIERASFAVPWPNDAYRNELATNRLASYVIARTDDAIVGFAGSFGPLRISAASFSEISPPLRSTSIFSSDFLPLPFWALLNSFASHSRIFFRMNTALVQM